MTGIEQVKKLVNELSDLYTALATADQNTVNMAPMKAAELRVKINQAMNLTMVEFQDWVSIRGAQLRRQSIDNLKAVLGGAEPKPAVETKAVEQTVETSKKDTKTKKAKRGGKKVNGAD